MKKTKLLLVDDEKPLLQNLKRILEFEDFDVVTAGNGIEGLSQYENERPDLVICDIMMPDMDGYRFIDTLRKKGFSDAPFIFLTAKSEYDDLRMGMSFGADDYLVKPVKSTQLIEAINTRLLRKRQIIQKAENQLHQVEEGFKLLADQEFFSTIYDIVGYLHLLKKKNNDTDAASREEYLNVMEKSVNRLLTLMGKVRNWKILQQALAEPHSGVPFYPIKSITETFSTGIADKYGRRSDLTCSVEAEANLPFTKEIVETLLNELIDNAFKFSEKGEAVMVNGKLKNDVYVLSIADNGKTAMADSLTSYKPFHSTTDYNIDPGTGLGLTIVELIVRSGKGSITYTNNSPCGIVVTVEMPIVKTA
jgi:two-component system sensor histidine kinase/response regulator